MDFGGKGSHCLVFAPFGGAFGHEGAAGGGGTGGAKGGELDSGSLEAHELFIHIDSPSIFRYLNHLSRWWQLKDVLFSSQKLGKMIPILTSTFFQIGWFNHQPVIKSTTILGGWVFSNNQESIKSRYATFFFGGLKPVIFYGPSTSFKGVFVNDVDEISSTVLYFRGVDFFIRS